MDRSTPPRDVNYEFIIRGKGTDISTSFCEPIIIPTDIYEAKIGLKGFVFYNSIPNVTQDVNNKISIKVPGDDDESAIIGDDDDDGNSSACGGGGGERTDIDSNAFVTYSLETGAYEISTINSQLQELLSQKYPKLKTLTDDFKLIGNDATGKAEFIVKKAGYGVSFNVEGSICTLLGFNKDDIFENQGRFVAGKIVDICPVTQLIFNTNVSESNYINDMETPFVYNCSIDVPPGYRISREINNISYKNLTTNQISFLRVWVTDQVGRPVNIRDDELLVTLSLKLEKLWTKVEVTDRK